MKNLFLISVILVIMTACSQEDNSKYKIISSEETGQGFINLCEKEGDMFYFKSSSEMTGEFTDIPNPTPIFLEYKEVEFWAHSITDKIEDRKYFIKNPLIEYDTSTYILTQDSIANTRIYRNFFVKDQTYKGAYLIFLKKCLVD